MREIVEGKWLYVITSLHTSSSQRDRQTREHGRFLWAEECVLVKRVRRVDRNAGKTGKGALHVMAPNYRCFDVEDIISVGPKVKVSSK